MNNESTESDEDEKQDPPAQEFVAELVDEAESNETVEDVAAGVLDGEPVSAVAAAAGAPAIGYTPSILQPPKPATYQQPAPSPLANLSAKGGAVGAMVLGVLSFAGSFITSYAILNSFMGVALGLWGLKSNHNRMALFGILLCLVSAFLCVLDISEWLQGLWFDPELDG